MSTRVAVLGGGISGVCTACELAKNPNISVDLFESGPQLGGLHKSVQIDQIALDIGYFVFGQTHEIFTCFPFLKNHFEPVHLRQQTITPRGSLDIYPMSIKTYIQDHGWLRTMYAGLDFAVSKLRFYRCADVPAYAKYHMGSVVYKSSGIQNYLERLYGIPDKEVGIAFAQQRLTYLKNYPIKRMLARALFPKRVPKTHQKLDHVYIRPKEGFEKAYDLIHQHLKSLGVRVHLNTKLNSIQKLGCHYLAQWDAHTYQYDRIVSTIPIPSMVKLVGQQVDHVPETMSLLSLFYQGIPNANWTTLFNFTLSGTWKRIINHSALYGVEGPSHLIVEITTRNTSPSHLEALRKDFEQHINTHHILAHTPKFLGSETTHHAYPVFRNGDMKKIQHERSKLTALGIDIVGRQGNFEYVSSNTAAIQARSLAQSISNPPA